MLDLNDLLLFIAFVSPIVVIGRTWRRAALHRTWRLASLAVLVVTGGAWVLAPRSAGFVGGGAWLLLLFAPAWGLRRVANLVAAQRFGIAANALRLLAPLHPARVLRDQANLLRALDLAQRGERDQALALLSELARGDSRIAIQAGAQRLRILHDWEGLLAWCERHLPRVGIGDDPALLPLYFRALGELERRDELVLQFAGRAPMLLASPQLQAVFNSSLALLFAYCGRTTALVRLFTGQLREWPESTQEFWLATSEAAAGDLGASRARLERLRRSTSDELIRADAAHRLARRGQLPPLPLSPTSEATVARFARDIDRRRPSMFARQTPALAPAVLTLIVLNLAAFGLEVLFGGSTNMLTLRRLGGLEPLPVLIAHQYWRLVAALFLHYGPLHLLFNLYALFVLGPALESWIGTLRFSIAYLLSGIGSSIGVLVLWRLGLTQADLLVGASGSIMGTVGTWAGALFGHRHAPVARQRLINIVLIVALQTAFDFYTPQVSMAAHLSGLVTGFVLGLLITPKHEL